MLNGRYGRVRESFVRQTAAGSGGSKCFLSNKPHHNFKYFIVSKDQPKFNLFSCFFSGVNPKAVPKIYLSKMYASQDYTNKEQGGLRFKSGDSVYVLLRNGGGWCTGKSNNNPKLQTS